MGGTSPLSDAAWEAFPDRAGECGARGRTCNPLPGGIGHQPAGTTTGARGAIAGLGQVGAGNARWTDRPNLFAASQEAWPGAEPLATRVPLARTAVERRQSCAKVCRESGVALPPALAGAG